MGKSLYCFLRLFALIQFLQEIFQCYDTELNKRNIRDGIEMSIICHHKICFSGISAIDKFVVVWIFDKTKPEERRLYLPSRKSVHTLWYRLLAGKD